VGVFTISIANALVEALSDAGRRSHRSPVRPAGARRMDGRDRRRSVGGDGDRRRSDPPDRIEPGAGKPCWSASACRIWSAPPTSSADVGLATGCSSGIYLHEEGIDDPVASPTSAPRSSLRPVDERFRVRVARDNGPEVKSETRSPEDAVWGACALWHFPIADVRRLRPGARYFVAFRADLTPSPRSCWPTCAAGWCSRRAASGASAPRQRFGSFVSIFVNPRVEDSERQLALPVAVITIAPAPLRGAR